MLTSLAVHFLPALVMPDELAAGDVVMIDVLRASTTITHALSAGAAAVIPCREVDEARQLAANLPAGEVVLGGERGGLPIEGFHLGNSREDVLCAGAISELLLDTVADESLINDQTRIAVDCWRAGVPHGARPPKALAGELSLALHDTQGGRNLVAIGLEHDIDSAAEVDRFDIVPQLDIAAWRIERA